MTVSIRRMTLGSGYRYLMSSVAQSDGAHVRGSALTHYYAETGTPPGRFLGAGLAGLCHGYGVRVGRQVSEEHLFRMLGQLKDPITGRPLGTPARSSGPSYGVRVKARILAETLAEILAETGETRDQAIERIKTEERLVESKRAQPVAGFDLTFSAPKSVSVAWALADPQTQALIYDAHQRALNHVIGYAEQHVFSSRSGKNGVVEEDILGVVAAAFDHWDSRSGDPQLHTHVVIMNRVQCDSDGMWRSLDSRGLFKATVALSEMYNGVLSDNLTEKLGYGWEPQSRKHSATPKWEIAGVPEQLQTEFSQRSAAIEETKNDLIDEFVSVHGRSPTSREVLQLRQQATLATRPDKHVQPLSELVAGWRKRAATIVTTDPESWVAGLANRNDLPLLAAGDLSDEMLAEVGGVAVDTVAGKRATFGRSNVFAEVLRQLHGVRFASADDRMTTVERTTSLALSQVLLISPADLAHVPAAFRRHDGTSRFRMKGHETFTTQELLDAEARLLDASRSLDGPRLIPQPSTNTPSPSNRASRQLSTEQQTAVEQIIGSGRVVDILVGPAGTGKSTTMAGLRAAWEHAHGPGSVIGLAPSATAADVLAEQVGIPTENTAKWLVENTRNTQRLAQINTLKAKLHLAPPSTRTSRLRHQQDTLCGDVRRWSLRAGQLVIVDEASLAGTFTLDNLVGQARRAGAKVVLVGDWAQLSPVEAGGAFHLLARDRDHVPELADVRRFTHPWEQKASVDLRFGLPDAADTYQQHGRIEGGDRDLMLDRLYDAWHSDIDAGRRSLMIAADNHTVTELNQRAQADRVNAGRVEPDGIRITSGATIGVGDQVVTRRNNRTLTTGTGWVKNGDQWTVTATHPDGSTTVTRTARVAATQGHVTLPAEYVRDHVDLGYATTAHGAQGRTVDTSHSFVSATTPREVLYVAATRGRDSNKLYVDTSYDPDADTAHKPAPTREATDVLRQVLTNPGADTSATETIAHQWAEHHSINRIWAEYQTIAATVLRDRYDDLIRHRSSLTTEQADTVQKSPSYGALVAALDHAQARGLDVNATIPRMVAARTLDEVDDIAAVLHERVDRWIHSTRLRHQLVCDRIVGLFPTVDAGDDPDMQQALLERRRLIEHRTRDLSEQAFDRKEAWLAPFGPPPAEPVRRAHWFRHVDTITAYRDRWGVTSRSVFGEEPTSLEQAADLTLARHAVEDTLRFDRPRPLAIKQERSAELLRDRRGPEV